MPETSHTSDTRHHAVIPPLPEVVKREIVSYLPVADAKHLALANREWKIAAESHLWAVIRIHPFDDATHPTAFELSKDDPVKSREAYKMVRQHLHRYPDRVRLIKNLEMRTWPAASDDLSVIIRSVAPTLEGLLERSNDCIDHSDLGLCDLAGISHKILAELPFPRLRRLKTDFDRNWPESLLGVLRMMPNLKDLRLLGLSHREDNSDASVVWPTLEKLSRLSINGNFHSMNVVTTLLPLCPSLRELDLTLFEMGRLEADSLDEEAVTATMLSVILNCSTLRKLSFELDPYFPPQLEAHRLDTLLEGRLPNLKSLSLDSRIVHPHCVPCHPTLEEFNLVWPGLDLPFQVLTAEDLDDLYVKVTSGESFGTKPSKMTSGKLSPALVERLESAPCLSTLTVLDRDRTRLWDDNLVIQSFTDGGRTLYHGRIGAADTAFQLDCHPCSYSTPPTSATMQWKDQPWNKFEINTPEEDLRTYLSRPPPKDSHYGIDAQDPDATDIKTDKYEFTYYKDHNLPMVLLDYVYSQTDCPRDWTEGQRGLDLPDHVWELLDGWIDEVEELRFVVA